jgi:cation diffusion facilitator family transporter
MGKKALIGDGRKIAACSSVLNLFLTGAKGYLALLTGSRALLAETVHSLTDVVGSLAVWSGIILSRRRSPSFPWGLYKVENIGALISAFFLLLGAYEIGKSSLIDRKQIISYVDMSVLLLFAIVIPIFLFARYEKRVAGRINSPSLMADSRHWMTDIAPLGVVMAGLGGSLIYPHADRFAALVIIVFIVKAGYKIVRDSVKSLLDASVDAKTLEKMRGILKGFSEIEEIRSLNARNSGSFIFVHLDIRLSIKKLEEAHHLADLVENAIRKEVPFVERVSIHYEPAKREYTEYAVPLASREGEISGHFGSAPFIGTWNKKMNEDAILSQQILDNPFLETEKGKGIKLAEFLAEKGVNVLYVRKPFEGKGPKYVFSNYEVEVRITDRETMKQLIQDIKSDQ